MLILIESSLGEELHISQRQPFGDPTVILTSTTEEF